MQHPGVFFLLISCDFSEVSLLSTLATFKHGTYFTPQPSSSGACLHTHSKLAVDRTVKKWSDSTHFNEFQNNIMWDMHTPQTETSNILY